MIWYIALALTAAAAALTVWALTRKRLGVMRLLYAMLGLLAITYILYVPPLFHEYQILPALLGGIINVLQVISLDADYLSFYDLIIAQVRPGFVAQIYFSLLATVHVMLPAVSAMSAAALLIRWLAQIQLNRVARHKRPLYILSDINDRSKILARSIRQHDRRGDILMLTMDDAPDVNELRQELGCTILTKRHIDSIRVLADKRPIHYYCISPDKEENLNAALSIVRLLSDKGVEIQKDSSIFLFSADPSAELVTDSVDKGLINFRIINECRIAAYDLLDRYPLYTSAEDGRIFVLICGTAQMSWTLLQAASWCGQLAGYRLSITLIGKDLQDMAADFQAEHPGLFTDRYDIRCLDYRNELEFRELIRLHCADATFVVVAGRDDDETVDRAVALRRSFYANDPSFRRAPPIFAYIENPDRAKAVASLQTAEENPKRRMSYDIVPFGTASEVYTFDNLTDSRLEKLARNVHLVYEAIFSGDDIDVDSSLRKYNLFEVNKISNRANALHIRYKLAMVGLDYTDDPDAEPVDLDTYMTEEVLHKLSLAEHDRWMAFLESEGWLPATNEQVAAYQTISKGRHNCPLLKMHPYICPNEALKERSEQLQGKDTTIYDRELIKRIPDILGDRWGAAGKSYRIVRRTTHEGMG